MGWGKGKKKGKTIILKVLDPKILKVRFPTLPFWSWNDSLGANCSRNGNTPSMLSTLERAGTWQFLVAAQPPGKHIHFRAESCGVRSQLWLSPAEWSWPTSHIFIGLSGNQRRIIPSLLGDVNTNEMFPAKVSCKMQNTLKCSFLLHLLQFYQMIFWQSPLTIVCVHFPPLCFHTTSVAPPAFLY